LSAPPLLEARGLRVAVPGRELIASLDLALAPGMFVALLGGNGAGKSLALHTLAGLRRADGGAVLLGGSPLDSLPRRQIARQLGFLPQDPEGPAQGTLAESVLLGRFAHLGLWETAGKQDEARVGAALETTGLAALAARELGSLSGGEQRRAAIARLLVQAPGVYLLDEPTNHLDPAQQLAVLDHLRKLALGGATVVASLHDPNLALRFACDACLLSGKGSARVVPVEQLDAAEVAALYGVPCAETRIGTQRFMAMG
jgi:iron complex transport system ATP-binding protein